MRNYYRTLEISPSSDPEAIKSAYRRLARSEHPDRGGTVAGFQGIKEAYELLSNPTRRAAYDESRAAWAALEGAILCPACGEANRQARNPPRGKAPVCGGCAHPLPDIEDLLRRQRRAAVFRKASEFASVVGIELAETAANAAVARIQQIKTRWTKGE